MDLDVEQKISTYPKHVIQALQNVRREIISIANELRISEHEEALKWGEPSFIVKGGSTIRYDWKPKTPDNYYLYFNCKTKLIDTFKEVYGDIFKFEGNRALVLSLDDPLPIKELRHCILLALTYHKVKHLPLLGV